MTRARVAAGEPTRPLPSRAVARSRALVAFVGPLVFLTGMAYHPILSDITDAGVIAEAIQADPTRWAVSHITIGIGFSLLSLAFLALRSYLHDAGEDHWSRLAVPLVVVACGLFVFAPALELAPLAAAQAGGDARAVQLATESWFGPIWVAASVLYALGVLAFSVALIRSQVLGAPLTWGVIAALGVTAAARLTTPWNLVLWGIAAVVAFWPLAYAMLERPVPGPSRARREAAA